MKKTLFLLSMIVLLAYSCSNDDSNDEKTPEIGTVADSKGLYIMCEGNWGGNNAAIDFLDISTRQYTQNMFSLRNPEVVMGLGDTSSDLQLNGNQLWAVVNGSNKIEVLSAETCKRIAKIDIPNCRYVIFNGNYAYVSSYVGPMAEDNVQLGTVFKIDTKNFKKVDSVVVRYQPEEMAIIDNKLYVACSGGYRYPVYDSMISVVDINSFSKTHDFDVALNLHRMRTDCQGQIWVTSRGNYADVRPSLVWLEKSSNGTMTIGGKLDIAVSDMCIVGDYLYYFGVEWDNATMSNKVGYGIINTKTHQKVSTSIFGGEAFSDIEVPYGIIVNPKDFDFYIADAKNYVSSGKLYHFSADGTLLWSTWTSEIPSKMVLVSDDK